MNTADRITNLPRTKMEHEAKHCRKYCHHLRWISLSQNLMERYPRGAMANPRRTFVYLLPLLGFQRSQRNLIFCIEEILLVDSETLKVHRIVETQQYIYRETRSKRGQRSPNLRLPQKLLKGIICDESLQHATHRRSNDHRELRHTWVGNVCVRNKSPDWSKGVRFPKGEWPGCLSEPKIREKWLKSEDELDREVNKEGNGKGEIKERRLTPLLRETASRIRMRPGILRSPTTTFFYLIIVIPSCEFIELPVLRPSCRESGFKVEICLRLESLRMQGYVPAMIGNRLGFSEYRRL